MSATAFFPGILASGTFALFRSGSDIVRGSVRWADGRPIPGALVSSSANGLVSVAGGTGGFQVPAPPATTVLTVVDPMTGKVKVTPAVPDVVFECPRISASLVGLVNGGFEDGPCRGGTSLVQVSDSPGSALNPAVAVSESTGEISVIWQDTRGIFFRRYLPDGSPATSEVKVSATGSEPDIAVGEDGRPRAVWLAGEPAFAVLDPEGMVTVGPITIGSGGFGTRPRIAMGSGDQANVVLEYKKISLFPLRLLRFDASGAAVGTFTEISTKDLFWLEKWPEIAVQTCGGVEEILVVFRDTVNIGDLRMRLAVLSPDGTLKRTENLAAVGIDDERPTVAASGCQRSIFWQRQAEGSTQIISSCGGVRPFIDPPGNAVRPRCAGGDGGVHVAWQDDRDANTEVYVARQDGSCAKADPPGEARLTAEPHRSENPDVAGSREGPVTVWQDDRTGRFQVFLLLPEDEPAARVPGWESCADAAVVDSGPGGSAADGSPWGRYRLEARLPAGATDPVLRQEFVVPEEARGLWCDVRIVPDAGPTFQARLVLGLAIPGTVVERDLSLDGTESGYRILGIPPDPAGRSQDAIGPFRGKKATLTLSATTSGPAALQVDGFRFGKLRLNVVPIDGAVAGTRIQDDLDAAARVFQSCGIAIDATVRQPVVRPDLQRIDSSNEADLFALGASGPTDPFLVDVFYVPAGALPGIIAWTWCACQVCDSTACAGPKEVVIPSAAPSIALAHEIGHVLCIPHVRGNAALCAISAPFNWISGISFDECRLIGGDRSNLMYHAGGPGKLEPEQATMALGCPFLRRE
jgi:hypothetical protein